MYNFYIKEKASNAEKAVEKKKLDAKKRVKRDRSKSIFVIVLIKLISIRFEQPKDNQLQGASSKLCQRCK